MPKIIDVIITKNSQIFLILDEMPEFKYERRGNCLVASYDGFYNTYYYYRPGRHWKAFAGREFDIPMKDGTVEHAFGQWWDGKQQENAPEKIVHVGYKTIDKLKECYVFIGGHVSKKKLEDWLSKNKPSENYYKYDIRNP